MSSLPQVVATICVFLVLHASGESLQLIFTFASELGCQGFHGATM